MFICTWYCECTGRTAALTLLIHETGTKNTFREENNITKELSINLECFTFRNISLCIYRNGTFCHLIGQTFANNDVDFSHRQWIKRLPVAYVSWPAIICICTIDFFLFYFFRSWNKSDSDHFSPFGMIEIYWSNVVADSFSVQFLSMFGSSAVCSAEHSSLCCGVLFVRLFSGF